MGKNVITYNLGGMGCSGVGTSQHAPLQVYCSSIVVALVPLAVVPPYTRHCALLH